MIEKRLNFFAAKGIGMAFPVEVDVSPCPVAVGFGRAGAEVATLALNSDAVEKAWGIAVGGLVSPFR